MPYSTRVRSFRTAGTGSALLSCVLACAAAPPARAFPELALRPGGTTFEGPTDPEVTSAWWNPAALAQLRGVHVLVDGQLLLQRGSIDRAAISSMTGLPGAGSDRQFSSTPISDTSWSGFAGVTYDFNQENLTIGFAVLLPWEQHRTLPRAITAAAGSMDLPAAYHLRSEDFRSLYFDIALGIRLSQKLALGANVTVVDSWASMSFDRDTALDGGSAQAIASGYENPQRASKVSVSGDGGYLFGSLPSPSGLGIGLGATYQPVGWLYLGASWSKMFPFNSTGGRFTSAHAVGSSVTPAISQGALCGAGTSGQILPCHGGGAIVYDIPDVWSLGARMLLPYDLELSTWGRVVVYGNYPGFGNGVSDHALIVQLSGDPVAKGAAPSRILIAESLTPTFAGEIGVRWRPLARLRLGLSVIAETSAVPGNYVTAAALDGPKLDGMFAAEVRLRWFRLMAGYELTGLFLTRANSPDPGALDPGASGRCADHRYALDACSHGILGRGDALSGGALPSNAGGYSLYSHRFSLALGFDY